MKVLVVASHPDDEVLGCGATMAKHSAQGDEVHIVILGQGAMSRNDNDGEDELKRLQADAQKSAKIVGAKSITFHDFPDNSFDSVALLEIVKVVEEHKKKIKPDIVYTHHFGDLNVDHRCTFEAVAAAFRPIGKNKPSKLLCFEVLSSSEWNRQGQNVFVPNHYVNVGKHIKKKLDAMAAYKSELCEFPHPRSLKAIEALSVVRGSEVTCEHAEAFYMFRSIE